MVNSMHVRGDHYAAKDALQGRRQPRIGVAVQVLQGDPGLINQYRYRVETGHGYDGEANRSGEQRLQRVKAKAGGAVEIDVAVMDGMQTP